MIFFFFYYCHREQRKSFVLHTLNWMAHVRRTMILHNSKPTCGSFMRMNILLLSRSMLEIIFRLQTLSLHPPTTISIEINMLHLHIQQ